METFPQPSATATAYLSTIPSSSPQQVLNTLAAMTQDELNRIYSAAEPGPIPDGQSRGKAILAAGSLWTAPFAFIASFFWQGKVIDGSTRILLNRVMGFRAVKATVYPGESWLDGKPSIIIDYQGTSFLCSKIRDEIRQVSPGVYLGAAYFRSKKPTFVLHFALDFRNA